MKRYANYLFAAFALLLLAGLIAWRLHAKRADRAQQDKAAKARKNAAPSVTVAPVQQRDIVQSYEAVGNVESPLNVKIASKVAGRIDYLEVREGGRVHAGQLLVRMDPSEVRAQVSQALADVAQAQSRLAQAQITAGATDVSITSQISQQQAGVASAQANSQQTSQNYSAQVAAARAGVVDAQGRVSAANAAIGSARAAIRSAQANQANAQTLYDRTDTLYKQGYVAAQDLDNALTQLQVQQAAVSTAQQQLSSAQSQKASALAQQQAAQDQANIVATKGKADIEAARQVVNQAKAALRTAVANRSQSPAYRANLRALQAAVSASQGALANAQAQLANTDLRSTIDGSVTARYADPGSTATVGQALLSVQAIGEVYVTTSVPEEIIRNIRAGQTGRAVFDALPGQTFAGRITQVNPAADPTTRQFTVRITLLNAKGSVKPGMFARVTFVTRRVPHAIEVPREAVKQGKKGSFVVVVDAQGIGHSRPVRVGVDDGALVQILSGVKLGEQVVTLSLQPVRDGQKVGVVSAAPQSGAPPTTDGSGAPVAAGSGAVAGQNPTGGSIQGSAIGGSAVTPGSAAPAGGASSGATVSGSAGGGNR